jgi:hypothetical protein
MNVSTSFVDSEPDPDPCVFGPPGSGSELIPAQLTPTHLIPAQLIPAQLIPAQLIPAN